MQDIETQAEIYAEVQRNLKELDRRYKLLQMKACAKHGVIIGVIIFTSLKIWGII